MPPRLARIGVAGAIAVVGLVSQVAAAAAAPAGPKAPTAFSKAVEIKPPPENSNTGRDDGLSVVACPSKGMCSAGGAYLDPSINSFPMVTGLVNGKWGKLTALALPDNQATVQHAAVNGIACGGPESCAVVGSYNYTGGAGRSEPFVADQGAGGWQQATQIALPANAMIPVQAGLSAIACTSVRNCAAVGNYATKAGNTQLMIIAEIAGIWQAAREVIAPRGAAKPVSAFAAGLSCIKAGRCVAVGGYLNGNGDVAPLTFGETNGIWRRATAIALPKNVQNVKNISLDNFLDSVSCLPTGFCLATGSYFVKAKGTPIRPMTLSGSKGLSGRAFEMTKTPLQAGNNPLISELFSVSCVSSARCVAVGDFERDPGGAFHAMSLIRISGRWGNGHEIVLPADAEKTSMLLSSMSSVSCTRSAFCAAVGGYVYVPDLNLDSSAMAAVMP
jgi:hypothetical protein